MDQPGSCQRALCECDLQLVKDLVSESNTWSKKNHQFYGFDLDDGCKADSAGMAGRSSILFLISPPATGRTYQISDDDYEKTVKVFAKSRTN